MLPTDNSAVALAIADRDVESLRELIAPVLSGTAATTPLRISLPKALSESHIEASKALVSVVKELVSASRAKAAAPRAKGAFCVCIVTPSAPRAASLSGVLSRGGCAIAKLFLLGRGRRQEIEEEQVRFLANNIVDVAIGTPNRLAKLAGAGSLELSALRYLLVDCTPDEKELHFFSAPSKGGARRPDAEALDTMLSCAAFQAALGQGKRAPAICMQCAA